MNQGCIKTLCLVVVKSIHFIMCKLLFTYEAQAILNPNLQPARLGPWPAFVEVSDIQSPGTKSDS